MALNETIVSFGTGTANYGALVGQSLAQLGQQVGQQLAMQEYRKQAAAELPFMQEAMKSAMGKIGQGDVAGGYMDAMMNLPLASQNPIVATAAKTYFDGLQQAAEFKQSALYRDLQYGRGRGGTATATGLPGIDPTKYGFPPTTNVTTTGGGGGGGMGGGGTPPVIVEPDSLPEGDTGAEEVDLTATPQEMNIPEGGTEAQRQAAINVQEFIRIPTDQQPEAARTYGATEYSNKEFELVRIPGLDKFLPGVRGALVPKDGSEFAVTKATRTQTGGITLQSELKKNEPKENFFKSGTSPEERGTKQNLEIAINTMKDKEMTSLFKAFNGNIFEMRAATGSQPDGDKTEYNIATPDGATQAITREQYEAINTLASIPSAVAIGAGNTPLLYEEVEAATGPATAELRSRRFNTVEEADASGLPSGTIVYILRDGQYRKARID